jgi:flagellar hook-associated protein 2
MAINSTSSATSAAAAPTSGPGKGSVIDVAGLVSKLEQIEQVPIDRLEAKVTKQDNAIRDLAIIKDRMSMFQAALQDFTDPFSYLKKSVTSSNPTVVSTSISNSSSVPAGVFNVNVAELAKTSTATFAFNFSQAGSIILKASDSTLTDAQATISLAKTGDPGIDTLEELRDAINQNSTATKVRAAIVNTGNQLALSITSITGGAASEVEFTRTPGIGIAMALVQGGADAKFTINGQEFTRPSNTVDEALAGVRLQLQGTGPITIVAGTENREIAQTLITNVGQAYNDLMASYTEFSKFNTDPAKRGSLYGFMELRGMMDSISMSFMSPLTRSSGSTSAPINDTGGNPISFTTLGLELQRDGTLLFKSAAFESAVNRGALEQLANGSVSPTRIAVNNAMTVGLGLDGFTTFYEKERITLSSRISELETRKAEKMARYQAQYASLDALLFRLQALNSSLTPTFEALNNPRR